jgi:hypothetical protein
MAQVHLSITTFSNAGSPVSYGNVVIYLNIDCMSPSGLICSAVKTSLPLDLNGTLISNPLLWQNANLSPSGSKYIMEVYSQIGQLVSDPTAFTL